MPDRPLPERHVAEGDGATVRQAVICAGDEKPPAKARAAAASECPAAAAAALRDHVHDRQVLDRDIADIDEQTAIGGVAIQHVARAVDGDVDASGQVEREQILRIGDTRCAEIRH
jgi:hypothetical protein